jgi:hypothetical protein
MSWTMISGGRFIFSSFHGSPDLTCIITKNREPSMKTKEHAPKAGGPSISLYSNAPFGQGDFTSLVQVIGNDAINPTQGGLKR